MMGVSTNLDEVKKQLAQFGEKASEQISKRATSRVGARVRTELRRLTPKETGKLRRSIRTRTSRDRKTKLYSTKVGLLENYYYKVLITGERKAYRRKNGVHVRAHQIKHHSNWFDDIVNSRGTYFTDLMAEIAKEEMIKEASKVYQRTARAAKRRVR